ncbi:MAG: 50S ribosomal protein L15 [Christensenellaceae bacterium]|jgi:large subunit ribosomal protein L15|nr:50S ribosomal protein L15 [Christensenellaceae bacterium]
MLINELSPHPKAKRDSKRLGRGIGSGHGKTSGKGHKGQWARSGGGVRVGFEGGQMPLLRRVPKRGFTNNFRKNYSIVNISALEVFKDGTEITAELLLDFGLLSKIEEYGLKVLGSGNLTKKLIVKANAFTKTAKEAIEKVGGQAIILKSEKQETK